MQLPTKLIDQPVLPRHRIGRRLAADSVGPQTARQVCRPQRPARQTSWWPDLRRVRQSRQTQVSLL